MALARELGVLDRPGVAVVAAGRRPTTTTLTRVHRADYLARGQGRAGTTRSSAGYGPRHAGQPGLRRHARGERAGRRRDAGRRPRRCGAARRPRAVNIAGGLHHAMPARASGFCVYNDPAVAIARLLDLGAERIAYVDIDVHHGDGVQDDLLRRPAGADGQPARDAADAVPRHRLPGRDRRAGRRGQRRQRRAAARHRRRAAGCARSTRWCRRCCARSGRRCCSPSAAPTRTGSTRSPTCG